MLNEGQPLLYPIPKVRSALTSDIRLEKSCKVLLSFFFLRRPMADNSFKACFHPSAWVLQPSVSTFAPNSKWSNRDMDPVPPKGRTWSIYNYVAYWISDAINPVSWELASSMLAVGLSWYDNFSSYMPAMLTMV